MASLRKKIIGLIIVIFLSLTLGVYIGLKNTSTYQIKSMEFPQILDEVKVYRDENGIPTIIANNEFDLFFAQGFEYARDRLWGAEFFRSVSNGELTRLFGDSLVDADKYLKSIGIIEAAKKVVDNLDAKYLEVLEAYIEGLNYFMDVHANNLPIEFTILEVKPKKWTVVDVISIQGVMARTLSIASLNSEFLRLELAKLFGPKLASDLYAIDYVTAEDYYLNQDYSSLQSLSSGIKDVERIISFSDRGIDHGSNAWVIGPDKSLSGNPILSNDPHLSLSTPSIWWRVNLVSPTIHVDGFALPGVPGIVLGHNEKVAWGMTNTGLDAVDVFYFVVSEDKSQYFIDGEWKDFKILDYEIPLSTGEKELYSVKWTDYGPVLDPTLFSIPEDEYIYVMRWTLLDDGGRDNTIAAILDLNRANSVDEIHEALRSFGVPGQNFVFASVDGDYGYQFTGLVPIRKTEGSGILPQNGSDPSFGWSGFVDYEDQYYVVNPDKGYFHTANEESDPREISNFTDSFYITDNYALPYRANRIQNELERADKVSVDDMQVLQGDVYNLYAKRILDAVLNDIIEGKYDEEISDVANRAIDELKDWKFEMRRNETGATLFSVFRIFFEELTFKDQFDNVDADFYDLYGSISERGMDVILDNVTSVWFDDLNTNNIENRGDIAKLAFEKTINYMIDNFGKRPINWKYDSVHKVVFEHPIGSRLKFFNEGDVASDGSEHTIKAAGGTPSNNRGKVNFVQKHGSSMRFLTEVEETWSNVSGITPPGESLHFLSGYRSDAVDDWVNNILQSWDFTETREGKPSFTYRKKSNA